MRYLKIPGLLLCAAPVVLAQAPKPLTIEKVPAPNTYQLTWNSAWGSTYFLQQSSNLTSWTYLPEVMGGIGGTDAMGFSSATDRTFFRILSVDLPTDDPLTADHDGDGIPSFAELTITHTDPLKFSTAGNGVSDRGKFPNPANGIYLDAANGIQYSLLANPAGVTGPKQIVVLPYYSNPDYVIQIQKVEKMQDIPGYAPFIDTTPPSNKRYLSCFQAVYATDINSNPITAPIWQVGFTNQANAQRTVWVSSDNKRKNTKHPLTGIETVGSGVIPTGLAGPPWSWTDPDWRGRWYSIGGTQYYYDIPPYSLNWDAPAFVYYGEYLADENTLENVATKLRATPPAYPTTWATGNPWAIWDVWSNQLGITYSRLKFRLKNNSTGVTNGEPAQAFIYFDPKGGGPREQIGTFQWDGQGQFSPTYTIDPVALKPGVEGVFHTSLASAFFELDLGQATARKSGKTVVIPASGETSAGAIAMSVEGPAHSAEGGPSSGDEPPADDTPPESEEPSADEDSPPGDGPTVMSDTSAPVPDVRFPGMDDTWYDGATIVLTQTAGNGNVLFQAVDPSGLTKITVPMGVNIAPTFFSSRGAYSHFDWTIEGSEPGAVMIQLTYSKGDTTLQINRSAIVTPKVNLIPDSVPLSGLARASVRFSNIGTATMPVLASNQMPAISIGGVAAVDVKQDPVDLQTFYFTPPAQTAVGEKAVKVSGLTIGGFAFTGDNSLVAADGFNYTSDLQLGLASFSSSIGVSIAEARSSALYAKSGGLSSDGAFEQMTSQINSLTNEEMSRVKTFCQGKTMTAAASGELDAMVTVNNFALVQAANDLYGGSVPTSTGGPTTLSVTPVLGNATFFTDARQWMADHGTRTYSGSYGSYAHFVVIEANEFDLSTWTTATTNHNIYDAMAANPKAKIIINGALFNFKAETFITTGIVYNNGVKLATSTDSSQGSFAVANLRYWFGQTTDNSMSANGTTAATYQFGGKGHPPAPPATPGPTDVHSSIGGMISCIWPDSGGNGQKVTPAQDSDLKVYAAMGKGSMLGYGMIGVDRHTGMMIILSKENGVSCRLDLFDVQNAIWSSGVDQAVVTDGGSSVALAVDGAIPVKGARHYGNSTARDTVTNYFAFTPIPVAKVTTPSPGASVSVGASVTVTATAKGGTGSVTKVEFYQGTMKIGEDSSDPYSITFTPSTAGASTLSAKVFDADGGTAKSINIPITVSP